MVWVFSVATFLFGIAVAFWVGVVKMESNLFLAILFTILGGVVLMVFLTMLLSRKIWSGRDKWYATSSYPSSGAENNPQNAIDKGKEWRSSSPQQSGQWFRVDLGKPKMLASIDFEPDQYWVEKPKKWSMMFNDKNRNVSLGKPVSGESFISVAGHDIPKLVQYITVYIEEPMNDMEEGSNYAKRYGKHVFWTISLRIKEYRFCIGNKKFGIHEL